jgi:hypothetical protein
MAGSRFLFDIVTAMEEHLMFLFSGKYSGFRAFAIPAGYYAYTCR